MSLLKRTFGEQETGRLVAAADPSAAEPRVGSAQRIRVGLTGLAAIFLLVLVAAAGMRPTQSMAAQDPAGEPLAVLGVAPGSGPAAAAQVVPNRAVTQRASHS